MDHGRVQYFGPFTSQAQTILSRYLPVPNDESGAVHAAPAKKKVDAIVPKTNVATDAKPVTSLRMGAAFWEFMKAGRAWACILAVCTGLLSQVRCSNYGPSLFQLCRKDRMPRAAVAVVYKWLCSVATILLAPAVAPLL